MSALKKNYPQQPLFDSWIEPAHYLRSDSPSAYFSLLTQLEGRTTKQQRSYPVASMGFVIGACDKSLDTWISQAEFWAPTRRLLHFMRVGLLFVDLDTYKLYEFAGLSAEAQLELLLRLCEAQGLPEPSLVIFSGRGLQAKWVLDSALPARALPRWSLVAGAARDWPAPGGPGCGPERLGCVACAAPGSDRQQPQRRDRARGPSIGRAL